MSKRVYRLSIDELAEALSNWLIVKYPELKDLQDADMSINIGRRSQEITVEVES